MTGPFQFTCHYDPAVSVIRLMAKGAALPDDIHQIYQQALVTAEQNHCNKVLLDVTNLHLNYDSSQVMQVFESLDPIIRQMQIARLVPLSEFKHDLIEEFAEKRGYALKNFSNLEQALAWLNA
ncbi:hypothetical protein [Bowmanella pacifica]|uniref:SpoIIAA-like n=1 Tax=Bowmanella pacifica TaxID=502051 RepID=A0A917YS01_9ALTE|nr:hypothetical protein [Bowmanella pacifica]GGO64323.1 hypothetical protein GCM10010982_03450 [Bowmanella pacifica]